MKKVEKLKKVKPKIEPRTKINQLDQALKGYTKSYEISIKNNKDPLLQLQNTRIALESHISSLLTSMNGLKFLEALKVTLSKISDGETIHKLLFSLVHHKQSSIIQKLRHHLKHQNK